MKNYAALILSITILIGAGFGFSSCKEDEPPVPPKLSFANAEMTVSEDDGIIEIEVVLDKPHGKDLNIEYDLGGTASDQDAVGTANADYEVVGNHGVVVIESGQTTGVIKLEIYNDAVFEEDETIEISIMDLNTSDVQLTADDEIIITITNDDAQVVASFVNTTMTVNEADGPDLLLVAVQLDNPAPPNTIIEYSILRDQNAPDAMDSVTAWNQDPSLRGPYDYYVNAQPASVGKLAIPAGATSANIELQIVSDLYFEDSENIRIQLNESTSAAVGTNNLMTIAIEQEDGKIIALFWDDAHTDVDMDMFLFIAPDVTSFAFPDNLLSLSIRASTEVREEVVFLPTVFSSDITEAAFGLSYVYYEGTAQPMNFQVHFIDYIDGAFEIADNREVFTASYNTANINAWDKEGASDPVIVQTFRIVNGVYTDLTGITVPDSGSRVKGQKLPKGLNKREWVPPSGRLQI